MYAGIFFAVIGVAAWVAAYQLFRYGVAILSEVVLLIGRKILLVIRARQLKASAYKDIIEQFPQLTDWQGGASVHRIRRRSVFFLRQLDSIRRLCANTRPFLAHLGELSLEFVVLQKRVDELPRKNAARFRVARIMHPR
jgi:hypothetical protein